MTNNTQGTLLRVRDKFKHLIFLHCCEQEGISSGVPSPQEWINAVDEATEALADLDALLGKIPDRNCDSFKDGLGKFSVTRYNARMTKLLHDAVNAKKDKAFKIKNNEQQRP